MTAWKTRKEMLKLAWDFVVTGNDELTQDRVQCRDFVSQGLNFGLLLLPQLEDMSNVQLWIQLTRENEQYFFERD